MVLCTGAMTQVSIFEKTEGRTFLQIEDTGDAGSVPSWELCLDCREKRDSYRLYASGGPIRRLIVIAGLRTGDDSLLVGRPWSDEGGRSEAVSAGIPFVG